MNWPSEYKLVGDSLIVDIALPEEAAGLKILNRDPRKFEIKPDCYLGEVKEVGSQCKLARVGDKVVFTRWIYSQSDVDDARICLREVDLVTVNDKCVNGFCAVQVYDPFQKTNELIQVGSRERPKWSWGKIVDIDPYSKNPDTKELREGQIILFQRMDDYQYWAGKHTLVFKNIPDVPLLILEESVA